MIRTVEAAGGVVVRRDRDGRTRMVLVHRPRYDDWSLPKGKLQPGEGWEQAALREVEEETGLRCRLGPELAPVAYRDGKGRRKQVRYWLMEPLGEEENGFEPSAEVDELRWCEGEEALGLLSYERDRGVAGEALRQLAGEGFTRRGG
jgi:8-oxo-dGTP diphosphatase